MWILWTYKNHIILHKPLKDNSWNCLVRVKIDKTIRAASQAAVDFLYLCGDQLNNTQKPLCQSVWPQANFWLNVSDSCSCTSSWLLFYEFYLLFVLLFLYTGCVAVWLIMFLVLRKRRESSRRDLHLKDTIVTKRVINVFQKKEKTLWPQLELLLLPCAFITLKKYDSLSDRLQ